MLALAPKDREGVGLSEGSRLASGLGIGLSAGETVVVPDGLALAPTEVHARLSPEPEDVKPEAHKHVAGAFALKPADEVELLGQNEHELLVRL